MLDNELRKSGIGGSEVGALFGCDELRDAFSVWAAKKSADLYQPEPTLRMIVGKALEPGVLKLYTHVTGRPVNHVDVTYQHPTKPWMLYTPDGLVPGQRRGVDAKVVAWDQRRKWGETAAEIPERIQLQCWWYMACMEYDAWDVVALIGDTPRVYEITRDREAERAMIERAEEWYRRYIVGDEMPEMGASEAAAQWLQRTFPTHKRPDLRFATTEEVALLTEYAEVRIAMAGLQRRKDELENAIKLAIAEKEGLVWETGKFTWRRSKDSQVTDWESLALALLTHHIKDEAERERVLDSYTRTKPGTRRIRFEHDLMRSDDAAA